jgi:hypothetical protein
MGVGGGSMLVTNAQQQQQQQQQQRKQPELDHARNYVKKIKVSYFFKKSKEISLKKSKIFFFSFQLVTFYNTTTYLQIVLGDFTYLS